VAGLTFRKAVCHYTTTIFDFYKPCKFFTKPEQTDDIFDVNFLNLDANGFKSNLWKQRFIASKIEQLLISSEKTAAAFND
jgi:hypothetical protein